MRIFIFTLKNIYLESFENMKQANTNKKSAIELIFFMYPKQKNQFYYYFVQLQEIHKHVTQSMTQPIRQDSVYEKLKFCVNQLIQKILIQAI